MSDDKKIPPMPPIDDWDKTRPNIAVPNTDFGGSNDWDKTNYNFPKQPPADEWGKTVANIKPIDTGGPDFGKTQYNRGNMPSTPEWGMTEAKVDLADANFGGRSNDYDEGYGKTTPYFRLPETERAKYENLPPTPTQVAEEAKKEAEAKGGIPGWVWVCAGLMTMFFFALIVFGIVWFIFFRPIFFDGSIKDAPLGSEFEVDGTPWFVSGDDNLYHFQNLKPGDRIVTIKHPAYTCESSHIIGKAGEKIAVTAQCKPKPPEPGEDCTKINPGEFDKAQRCFNAALKALPQPPPIDDLIKALNLLIINFETGKYDIPPVRMAALKDAAEYIKKLSATAVLEVGGHTDDRGTDASNQTLSENRAKAVREALIKFGVKDSALTMKGYGESKPKADNTTEDGRFQNRRIEYSVISR